MKVIIIGGSGFIGTRISKELVGRGYSVVSFDVVAPSIAGVAFVSGDSTTSIPKNSLLSRPDVVINLAGQSIVGPWDKEHKQSIYTSRIITTRNVVSLFKDPEFRPGVFIQAGAVGVYGTRGEETLSEGSETRKNTYLAEVAHDWEKEGSKAIKYGVRTIIIRQGNVLGKGGILSSLKPFYQKGLGGPVGSGKNWFPWIHIDDLVSIYVRSIQNQEFQGILNAVSGEVVRYKDFSRLYARLLAKPHFLRIPKFLFRLKYKGFTDEITASQKVVSIRLWELGDLLRFKTLEKALRDILSS